MSPSGAKAVEVSCMSMDLSLLAAAVTAPSANTRHARAFMSPPPLFPHGSPFLLPEVPWRERPADPDDRAPWLVLHETFPLPDHVLAAKTRSFTGIPRP